MTSAYHWRTVNMRKSLGFVALAIVVLMTISSVFIGCSNEIDGSLTGSLTVRTSSANARTISPTPAEIGIVSYKVNGVYSDTITAFPEVTSSSNDITVENLLVGDWTITLDGLNESGVVIATKTQVVTIYERQNTAATFYLELFSGTGTVSIAIQWPSSVTSFTQIKGTITPVVAGKEGFTVSTSTATLDATDNTLTITETITDFPTGSYQFKLEFTDEAGTVVGLPYREALNVYKNMTSSKTYTIPEVVFPIETPVISMDSSFNVSISCATPNVIVYYTTDGNDPTIWGAEFSTAFPISQNTTVKAIAVREDRLSSAVEEAFLEVPAAAPTFSLDAGTYDSPRTITLISATNGATIYYSLDGMITSTEYREAIPINENTVVTAYAVHPNHSNSSVSSAAYKIQAGKPTFSLKEGSYSGAQTLDLFSATDGATIYYTTGGLAPTTGSQVFGSSISLNTTTTVKAYAVKENMEPSAVSQSIYTIYLYDPVSAPTFTVSPGTFEGPQTITISTGTEGTTIYYTLDGEEPTRTSSPYSNPITISENTTVKAYAVKEGAPDSATTSGTYFIKPFKPTFSVSSGTYMESKTIGIESETLGTAIYYTLDDSTPTRSSNYYWGPFTISTTTTVKALAIKDNMADSDVASAEYTIAGSSGIRAVNPANYSVEIALPDGWETGPVVTGAGGTITTLITPTPAEHAFSYTWYLDGVEMMNTIGTIASTTDTFNFGLAGQEVSLKSGPHILTVVLSSGSMEFSDQKIIIASTTGTVGTIDAYEVGDIGPSGGYVFYDDEIGYDLDSDGTIEEGEKNLLGDGKRYLEAAPSDLLLGDSDYSHIFGYYRTTRNGAPVLIGTATGIGAGQANTTALVAAMGSTAYITSTTSTTTTTADYAARMCDIHEAGGYSDWFLPSKDELNMMHMNLKNNNRGGFSGDYYWSSSEGIANYACYQNFNSGTQHYDGRNYDFRVRPVRAF